MLSCSIYTNVESSWGYLLLQNLWREYVSGMYYHAEMRKRSVREEEKVSWTKSFFHFSLFVPAFSSFC